MPLPAEENPPQGSNADPSVEPSTSSHGPAIDSRAHEEAAPHMLDIHPIHGPVMGWREFLTHILIIAIGLCLALALQETVEYLHHRYQLAETQRALRLEREENRKVLADQTAAWRWSVAELQNNLAVLQFLQQHPDTPQEKLPGVLMWKFSGLEFSTAVWDAARQTGVTALMPREEIEANNSLYRFLQNEWELVLQTANLMYDAERYTLLDSNPSHMTPAQVAEEIQLTQAALSKTLLYGTVMLNLVESYPDFPATISRAELNKVGNPPDHETQELLSGARSQTMQRLKAAGYAGSE
jgi:hypothetical protein